MSEQNVLLSELGLAQFIWDRLPCGILVTDLQPQIVYCNETFAGYCGKIPSDLIGKATPLLGRHPENKGIESSLLPEVLSKSEWRGVLPGLCADGLQTAYDVRSVVFKHPQTQKEFILTMLLPLTEQVRQEREIRLAQAKYRALLSDIPEAVVIFDAETLKILEVNETAISRYGYTREEWLRMTVLDIRPPEDIPRTLETISQASLEEQLTLLGSFTHVKKDGTRFPVNIYRRLHELEGRKVIVSVAVDMTEQARFDAKRREIEELRRRMITNNPRGICVLGQTGDGQFSLELMNPAAERLFNCRASETIGKSPEEVFPPKVAASLTEICREVIRDQVVHEREETFEGIGFEVCNLRCFPGGQDQVVATWEDLTQRRKTEEALRESQAQLNAVFEASADCICTFDRELKFTNANSATTRVLGVPLDQLRGKWAEEIPGNPPVSGRERAHAQKCLDTGEPQMFEEEYHSPKHMWLNFIFSPLRDPQGNVTEVMGIVRDVTALRQLEAQMAQTSHLEAMGRLARGIAFDFNNLLACIQGNLDLVLMGALDASAGRQSLIDARAASQRAGELVRQVLVFTRQAWSNPQNVDLRQVVTDVLGMLRGSLSQNITVNLEGRDSTWQVRIDPAQAGQVVMNLCLNARDAMPCGGTLTIRLANVALDEATKTSPQARAGQFVRLSILDTGSGISQENLARLFEPFFSTKPLGEGTGLGLSVVYGIVSQAGGWVEVASQINQGTRFDIYLPKAE